MYSQSSEPIAIIGLGCRFPGARSIPEYWRMMCEGVDAIREVPPERWDLEAYYDARPATPGKMITRHGGFLEDLDLFDPYFFGLSPREAVRVDPQQRLLLEVAWEAMEDAGMQAEHLVNSQTGVFVGVCTHDYTQMQHRNPRNLDAYVGTGSARAGAGRVANVLGLNGPAMVVDTACSSSMVAVHLAVESLQRGECTLAFAAGTNAVLQPTIAIAFSQGGMLSPEGRCKAFDASANGFVRSEGAGLVVLKQLSRAIMDKDRIYAVIRGSAVNNDSAFSTFMMPAREGQEAVLRQAYVRAGVSPADVDFVEAHGTGTRAGDPVEVAALNAVLGAGRPQDRPCRIGAGKTNIGHTEAAAGIAGLIKTALCLHHGAIPANLHCRQLTPNIPWDEIPFVVQRELTAWPKTGRPALAAANSFGITGTNAHVVLEEAPVRLPVAADPDDGEAAWLLPLSAKSPEALRAGAASYIRFLDETPEVRIRDICYSASRRRGHHDYRYAFVGNSRAELRSKLQDAVADESRFQDRIDIGTARPIFVFSGVGSQWVGMGRHLRQQELVFREAMAQCDEAIRRVAGWSVLEEIEGDHAARLDRIDIMQPAIFSIQVALAALWRSWGIEPAGVAGHSLGEYAAAYVAGALSLEDAALGVCTRSRLMNRATGQGRMLAVALSKEEAQRVVDDYGDLAGIAACNSPASTVLSGDPAALDQIREKLAGRDIFCSWLKVEVACHSVQMERLIPELLDAARDLEPRSESLPLYSSVTAERIAGSSLGADYWARNLRQPVLFAALMECLLAEGHEIFLELSPHPTLQMPMRLCARDRGKIITVLPSLRREEDGPGALLESLGALYTRGAKVDWDKLHPGEASLVSLPGYQWQRERFWFEDKDRPGQRTSQDRTRHPLLQLHWESAQHPGTHFWETELSAEYLPYLEDHCFQGIPLVPAALYAEMALAASTEVFGSGPRALRNLEILKALFLPKSESKRIQFVMWPDRSGTAYYRLFCFQQDARSPAGHWTEHARGQVDYGNVTFSSKEFPGFSHQTMQAAFPIEMNAQQAYDAASSMSLDYGPAFQATLGLRRKEAERETVAECKLVDWIAADASRYQIHPVLLDAITHGAYGIRLHSGPARSNLPVEIELLEVHRIPDPHARLWCHVRNAAIDDTNSRQESRVYDAEGQLVLVDVRKKKNLAETAASKQDATASWLFEPQWEVKPVPEKEAHPVNCLIVGDGDGFGLQLAAAFPTGEVFGPARSLLPDPVHDVVYLGALEPDSDGQSPIGSQERICGGALRLLHQISAQNWPFLPRLWLVTRGAHRVRGEQNVSLSQAPILGLGRSMANEYPQLRVTRVDLPAEASTEDAQSLAAELLAQDNEPEVAFRGGERYVLRLAKLDAERSPLPRLRKIALGTSASASCQLETTAAGLLDNLTLRSVDRRPPGPGEIEIRVSAVGLNFLDVLRALNMLPPEAMGPSMYGMECSGRIVAIGAGVDRFRIGDEVILRDAHTGCFRAFLTAGAAAASLKPAHLTMEEAATIPVAYQTAYYALHHLARVQRGESVLIHSAAGGVGLAAVGIAQQTGAEIFATAGSPEKREYLQSLGVKHVFNSRTLDFAAQIMEATGGRGVDIALNSLAGEAIPKTLGVLATGGRFLEIGKRDIYGNSQIGLFPFQKNLSFFAIDLLRMSRERPEVLEKLKVEVAERIADGTFRPLPYTSFSIRKVADAFHYMAQGKHIGKIVVSFEEDELEVEARKPEIRADATYLITGGLGGLGLACAGKLVEEGARHLVLVGRRGETPDSLEQIAAMRKEGAEVVSMAADVSRRDEVAGVLQSIRDTMPPLRGVIHAAGVLRDGILANLDWNHFVEVFPAKAGGAWNLHTELEKTDLDFFVLFSSVASVLGTPGQANYAAANAFLDALAHYRQARGLPAVAIGWGAWSEIGMAARLGEQGVLSKDGFGSISPRQGVDILARLLRNNFPHVAVLPIDWEAWAARADEIENPLFARFTSGSEGAAAKKRTLEASVLGAENVEAGQRLLEEFLRAQACAVLRVPESKLDTRAGLDRLGLDSLMAVELKNRIERELPLTVPVVKLLQGPSISQLADTLYRELKSLADSLTQVSEMSDQEVTALLSGEVMVELEAAT